MVQLNKTLEEKINLLKKDNLKKSMNLKPNLLFVSNAIYLSHKQSLNLSNQKRVLFQHLSAIAKLIYNKNSQIHLISQQFQFKSKQMLIKSPNNHLFNLQKLAVVARSKCHLQFLQIVILWKKRKLSKGNTINHQQELLVLALMATASRNIASASNRVCLAIRVVNAPSAKMI